MKYTEERDRLLSELNDLYQIYNPMCIGISEKTHLYGCSEDSVQLNSLNLLKWFLDIEKEYDIEITEDQKYVSDIIDIIQSRNNCL